jgi:ClpP class serine protease
MFSNTVGQKKLSVCMELTGYLDGLMVCRMWREIRLLAASKPVIASMSDVAASGGYYMAMAADAIVAENLTLTGSIGVVTGELEYRFYN